MKYYNLFSEYDLKKLVKIVSKDKYKLMNKLLEQYPDIPSERISEIMILSGLESKIDTIIELKKGN